MWLWTRNWQQCLPSNAVVGLRPQQPIYAVQQWWGFSVCCWQSPCWSQKRQSSVRGKHCRKHSYRMLLHASLIFPVLIPYSSDSWAARVSHSLHQPRSEGAGQRWHWLLQPTCLAAQHKLSQLCHPTTTGMIFFLLLLSMMTKQDSASLFYSKLFFTVLEDTIK